MRPIPALDLGVSLSYAHADKKMFPEMKKDYGMELDVTATYKITNNLSYMLGVGYLWTGNYWRVISQIWTSKTTTWSSTS